MNYTIIGRYLGILLTLESAFLVIPAAISLYDREMKAFIGLIITIAITFIVGMLLRLLCRRYERMIYHKEGFVLVALA